MTHSPYQETAALADFDTQTLHLPDGRAVRVTANWYTWLAYEELLALYGWSEAEILALFLEKWNASGGDPSPAFIATIDQAYAGYPRQSEPDLIPDSLFACS